MSQIKLADLSILAIPRIEITSDTLTEIEAFKAKLSAIPVDLDTKIFDNVMTQKLEENYRTTITANLEHTAFDQSIIELTAPSVKVITIQTVTAPVPANAKGTDSHRGGLAKVDDGTGNEIIIEPNKEPYIHKEKGSKIVDLPKGTKIIPAEESKEILKQNSIPAYADGTGTADEFLDLTDVYYNGKFYPSLRVPKSQYKDTKFTKTPTTKVLDGTQVNSSNSGSTSSGNNYPLNVSDYNSTPSSKPSSPSNSSSSSTSSSSSQELDLINQKIALYQLLTTTATESIATLTAQMAQYKNADGTYQDNETTRKLVPQINAAFQAQKAAQLAIKALIQEKYNAEFAGFEKEQTNNQTLIDNYQKQIEYGKLIGKDEETLISLNEKSLSIKRKSLDSLTKERDAIQAELNIEQAKDPTGKSQEIDILNQKLQTVTNDIIDANSAITNFQNSIIQLSFDKINKELDEFTTKIDRLKTTQQLVSIVSPDNLTELNKISQQMYNTELQNNKFLTDVIAKLRQQLSLLDSTSSEWATINSQINQYNSQLGQSNVNLVTYAKGIFSNYVKDIQNNSSKNNPAPTQPADNSSMVDGLLKQLEVQKIINFANQNQLTVSKEQLDILNAQGAIKQESLDMVQKELEVQQLQLKLQNQLGQKNIQQLTKKTDGTWDYTYVADQSAIDQTKNDLLDKQIAIEQQKKSDAQKAAQDATKSASDSYQKSVDNLNKILSNAENRVYKTADEFRKALKSVGLNLPIDEMVAQYSKYFTDTGNVLIQNSIQTTVTSLLDAVSNFKQAGDTAGENYTTGLLSKIDGIINGDGTLAEKQKAITNLLASAYADFALVGNKSGMSFIQALITSMGTEDYQLDFNTIATTIRTTLETKMSVLTKSGDKAGADYVGGLLSKIDAIIADKTITNKMQAIVNLLGQDDNWSKLGELLGKDFTAGLGINFENAKDDTKKKSSEIVQGLEEDVKNFGDVGTKQGEAYKNSIVAGFTDASNQAKAVVDNLAEYISGKSFEVSVTPVTTSSSGGSYSEGGVIDYTGNATVHGSKSSSEVAFNATQAKKLYDLVKNLPNGLDITKIPIRTAMDSFKIPDISKSISSMVSKTSQSVQQVFHIDNISFPNVNSADGLESAFKSLPLKAAQKAKVQYGI